MGIAKYAGGVRQRTNILNYAIYCFNLLHIGLKDREFSYRARIVTVAVPFEFDPIRLKSTFLVKIESENYILPV